MVLSMLLVFPDPEADNDSGGPTESGFDGNLMTLSIGSDGALGPPAQAVFVDQEAYEALRSAGLGDKPTTEILDALEQYLPPDTYQAHMIATLEAGATLDNLRLDVLEVEEEDGPHLAISFMTR